MEEDASFEMDDFVTVDEVGDFAEEGSHAHGMTQAGVTEGPVASSGLSPAHTAAQPEDTAATREEEEEEESGESRVSGAGVHHNRIDENVVEPFFLFQVFVQTSLLSFILSNSTFHVLLTCRRSRV